MLRHRSAVFALRAENVLLSADKSTAMLADFGLAAILPSSPLALPAAAKDGDDGAQMTSAERVRRAL
jgi:serine/threonine protein kinase